MPEPDDTVFHTIGDKRYSESQARAKSFLCRNFTNVPLGELSAKNICIAINKAGYTPERMDLLKSSIVTLLDKEGINFNDIRSESLHLHEGRLQYLNQETGNFEFPVLDPLTTPNEESTPAVLAATSHSEAPASSGVVNESNTQETKLAPLIPTSAEHADENAMAATTPDHNASANNDMGVDESSAQDPPLFLLPNWKFDSTEYDNALLRKLPGIGRGDGLGR